MDSAASLFLSVILGAVGMGFFIYGTRQKAVVPFLCGLGLMGLPYFISNMLLLVMVGLLLTALPFIIRM